MIKYYGSVVKLKQISCIERSVKKPSLWKILAMKGLRRIVNLEENAKENRYFLQFLIFSGLQRVLKNKFFAVSACQPTVYGLFKTLSLLYFQQNLK